jgi:hypothetical protein
MVVGGETVGVVPGVTGSTPGCCTQPLIRTATIMAATEIPKERLLDTIRGTRQLHLFLIDGKNPCPALRFSCPPGPVRGGTGEHIKRERSI